MSLGKVSNVGNLGKELEGLTPDEIKERVVKSFEKVYGRYENVSGQMWAEVYKNEGDESERQVIWRKGTVGKAELTEDFILTHPQAILKFMELVHKGYHEVFKAITQAEMDKGNALRIEKQSAPQREGWLGTYYKGPHFFRISQFTADEYYIERGYDGCPTSSSDENEDGARFELDKMLDKGYRRENEDTYDEVNPLEAFGIGIEPTELKKEKKKPVDGELPDDFFDMMR